MFYQCWLGWWVAVRNIQESHVDGELHGAGRSDQIQDPSLPLQWRGGEVDPLRTPGLSQEQVGDKGFLLLKILIFISLLNSF